MAKEKPKAASKAMGFNMDDFSSGGLHDIVAEAVESYLVPWKYPDKKDGSRPSNPDTGEEINWYVNAWCVHWAAPELSEPYVQYYSAGSICFKPRDEEEATGGGWFPSADGESYVGGHDVDELREMASQGGIFEYDIDPEDEDYHGNCLIPVPDEEGVEPARVPGGTNAHTFMKYVKDAEGGEEFMQAVDMSDVGNFVGTKCHLMRMGKGDSGPPYPTAIVALPSGGGKKSGKASSKSSAKSTSKASSSKEEKSSKKSSKAKKSSSTSDEVDEDRIEAAITSEIKSNDGEINLAQAIKAARSAYKKEGGKAMKAAMSLAQDEEWVGSEDRPWEYDEEESTLRAGGSGGDEDEEEEEDDED